ncbi:glycosyl hydrolase family 28-related protein [Tistrella sp. BH-R2-4]|uniref:Glycosyl hydrolase family 28-related protein n=1 Tax=Tistrella arctica TaxID=3133430 RepID=A0ABU9YHG4_9PROT
MAIHDIDEPAIVDTIADLRGLSTTGPWTMARVLGYHTAGDGAGGLFQWDASAWKTAEIIAGRTTPDDGGTRIVPTGQTSGPGLWRRVAAAKERLNVRCFGARGDSTTDDSDAFEAACFYGPVHVSDGTYKLTRRITMYGRTNLIGTGPGCALQANIPEDYILYAESGHSGLIENVGFKNCVTRGAICLTYPAGEIQNGAHLWMLRKLRFWSQKGPAIVVDGVYDMNWADIDIYWPEARPGVTPTPQTDAAVVFLTGTNNLNIDGLHLEQPRYCGVHVASGAEISVQEGKIDCYGDASLSPTEGGFHIDGGSVRLSNFLFAGVVGPRIVMKGTASLTGDSTCSMGGAGNAPQIVLEGSYGTTGATYASLRPTWPKIAWMGSIGYLGGNTDQFATCFIDARMPNPLKRKGTVTVASAGNIHVGALSDITAGAGYDNRCTVASATSGHTERALIWTDYTTTTEHWYALPGVTASALGMGVDNDVFVEHAPHHRLDVKLDPRQFEFRLPIFATLLTTTVTSASYDATTGYTTVTVAATFPKTEYQGRWLYTDAGRWHKILEPADTTATDISTFRLPYDVTAEFPAATTVTVRTGAMVNASITGDRVVWGRDDMLVSASLETLRTKGRGPNEVYPLADGA